MNKNFYNSENIKNFFEWSHKKAFYRFHSLPLIEVPEQNSETNISVKQNNTLSDVDCYSSLKELEISILNCSHCELSLKRNKTVFGEGNSSAQLMFIGEGPGYDEDMSGRPFVGKAGQLLTQIIENGLKISRESVYIANIVKCRPPNNRDPLETEAKTCLPYLIKQIELIQPKIIVLLGKVAAKFLLNETGPISNLRIHEYFFKGIKVFITYHPSALLRNESLKRPVWEDMKKVIKELNL